MADVTLRYKGSTIAELSASGSKTIQTAGKYCEDDIGLVYVRPGGGLASATGTVTVLSEVAGPTASQSLVFPGIQLDFQADFIFVCLDNTSTAAIKSTATNNHLYWCFCADRSLLPIIRVNSSSTSDAFPSDLKYMAVGGTSFSTDQTAPNGYGVAGSSPLVEARAQHWSLNADGTFSYGQLQSQSGTALNPGTYRYFALKVT